MIVDPPGEPATSSTRAVAVEHDRRRHRGQHALAGFDRIRIGADDAVEIGRARLGAEVVHLVVEQEPRARDDDAAAEIGVERVGVGDGVAPAIDDREMRRVARLRQPRPHVRRAPRSRRDSPPPRGARRRRGRSASRSARRRNRDRPRIPRGPRTRAFPSPRPGARTARSCGRALRTVRRARPSCRAVAAARNRPNSAAATTAASCRAMRRATAPATRAGTTRGRRA